MHRVVRRSLRKARTVRRTRPSVRRVFLERAELDLSRTVCGEDLVEAKIHFVVVEFGDRSTADRSSCRRRSAIPAASPRAARSRPLCRSGLRRRSAGPSESFRAAGLTCASCKKLVRLARFEREIAAPRLCANRLAFPQDRVSTHSSNSSGPILRLGCPPSIVTNSPALFAWARLSSALPFSHETIGMRLYPNTINA